MDRPNFAPNSGSSGVSLETGDIVLSHTAPLEIVKIINKQTRLYDKYNGPSSKLLSRILDIYKPKKWYFGHFYERFTIEVNGCQYEGLGMLNPENDDFWVWNY